MPFEAARTREHLAAFEPALATALLRAALETYERLGARPRERAVRSRLLGGHRTGGIPDKP